MADVPLPKPEGVIYAGNQVWNVYTPDQMHAHAAAVTAAARDCRTCRNLYVPHQTCIEDVPCTDADRYDPLPPVRLWRTT